MRDQAILKTWRRWLRLSVRSLMVVILIIGCGIGWIIHRARAQRTAVSAVKKAGGVAIYACEYKSGSSPLVALSSWRSMIADSIGIDFVDHVVLVQIQDAGLETSRQKALARLVDFQAVEYLNLVGSSVTNDVLAQFQGMNRLRVIMLQNTRVTDAGLVRLKGLTSLEEVYLTNCDITDAGLGELKALTRLASLSLINTRITDAGLHQVIALPALKELSLDHSNVTDAAVPTLKRLGSLKKLSLAGTKISTSGVEELEKALPNTSIASSFSTAPVRVKFYFRSSKY